MDTITILASAFVMSVVALTVFILSMRRGLFAQHATDARVIFAPHEVGQVDDPSATPEQRAALQATADPHAHHPDPNELAMRIAADRSSANVTFVFLISAVGWLVFASVAGVVASIKLHQPDWLTQTPWLTFGRVRVMHLNATAYGWLSMAGFGIAMWLLPRLLKTQLAGARSALLGAMLWNAGLIAGVVSIGLGFSAGLEWLELPWPAASLLIAGAALIVVPLLLTVHKRTVDHLYVSVWYMGAALFWFPVLYLVAKIPGLHFGVEQATMNWWYAHNVLGLFFTPLALASIYYFMPKIIGRPVQSYNLSLLGFWTLAFFYPQVGGHHLIGGPVPGWLITLSIVQSMMMLIPVIAFSVNLHATMRGYYKTLLHSRALAFIIFGGVMYLLSSVQGSLHALRSVNAVTHFTHSTVGHAHFGLYAFVTMAFFGAIYCVMPRVTEREWPYPKLISVHFWMAAAGITVYVVSLTIGGWFQGEAMLDAARPFMESVALTIPYLKARTVAGLLMTVGHLVFLVHFCAMVLKYREVHERHVLRPAVGA